MKSLPAQQIKVTPFVDLETYLLLSGNKRISGDLAVRIESGWQWVFRYLQAYRLGERKGYLVLWLKPEIETELDRVREQDPDWAEELHIIAQCVIMATMLEILPECGHQSCAPLPEPNKVLKRSLSPLGLEYRNDGTLNVRFGVVTPLPYRGECEECYLKDGCSKRIMQSQQATWTV